MDAASSLISQAEGSSQGACGSKPDKKLLWKGELVPGYPQGLLYINH